MMSIFSCLLASYVSSFEKCLLISFAQFWMGLFFSCISVLVLCRFWLLALCQMGRLQTFFSHSVGCRFTLIIVSFAVQKLWSLIRSHLSILAFAAISFGVFVMKSLSMPMSWMILPRFFPYGFLWLWLLHLSFQSILSFLGFFCIMCKEGVQFHFSS